MEIETGFRTKDFWLTAALIAAGCGVPSLEWEDRTCYFVFKSQKANANSEKYWAGTLKVPARGMTDALRTLKDRMHSK